MAKKYNSKEVYRQAIWKWKENNPEKKDLDIKKKDKIDLEGIGTINIGVLIIIRRGIYNAMLQGKNIKHAKI